MKRYLSCIYVVFFLIPGLKAQNASNELEEINRFSKNLDEIFAHIDKYDTIPLNTIKYVDGLIKERKYVSAYYNGMLKLLLARAYSSVDMDRSNKILREVDEILRTHPDYKYLRLVSNTIRGRQEFETNRNCQASYSYYESNLNDLEKYVRIDAHWNLYLETKIGLISAQVCMGNDVEALKGLEKLESRIDTRKNEMEYLYVLGVMGYLHTKNLNYVEGEKYFKKMIKHLENGNEHLNNYFAAINNLGYLYRKQSKNLEAEQMMIPALKKAKEAKRMNDVLLISNNLAVIEFNLDKDQEAEKYVQYVLQNAGKEANQWHLANAQRMMATIYLSRGELSKADQFINEALKYYRVNQDLEVLRDALNIKNKILLKQERFQEADLVNSEIISLLDSVSLNKNIQELQKSLIGYETERKQKEIDELSLKNRLSSEENKRKSAQLYGAITVGVLLVAFLLLFLRYKSRLNRIRSEIENAKLSRAQVNPHFLNNAFTSIQALAIQDDKSEEILHLTSAVARFSRLMLESTTEDLWMLRQEVEMIQQFCEIYLQKFPDRYAVRMGFKIDAPTQSHVLIPSALLQPIVENAFEYAAQKEGVGQIDLQIYKENDEIIIRCANSIAVSPLLRPSKRKEDEKSRGMEIVTRRIALYNASGKGKITHSFEMNGNQAVTTLTLKP